LAFGRHGRLGRGAEQPPDPLSESRPASVRIAAWETPAVLTVRVLGALELESDQGELALPTSRRARDLLGLLAITPGPQPRSRLAGRLRPHVDEEIARSTLRQAATDLRKSLGEGAERWVVGSRDALGLDPGSVSVDLDRFRELVAAGELEAALSLCGGPLLDGIDAEWAEDERRRHAVELDQLLGALVDQHSKRGEATEALRAARRRVELDPLAEAPRRQVIECLARMGDRAAALSEYERLRMMLRDELGLSPDADTRSVVDRLLTDAETDAAPTESESQPEPPALPGPLRRRHRSPFTGREAEFDSLRDAWQEAVAGEVQLALVGGEPGIGKSRLCAELAREVFEEGAAVLFGRCYEEALTPYQPFVEALTGFAERLDESRLGAEADPDGARLRLFASAADSIAAHTASRPALLVLEDLHWADRASALMLGHLARTSELAPLAIVGTYRPGETPADHPLASVIADLGREQLIHRIRLTGLSTAEISQLAAAWPKSGASSIEQLADETGGNPFFVEEVLRHVAAGGDGSTPEGLREMIEQRLVRLGPGATELLGAASVLGARFATDVLESCRPIEGPLAAPLDAACRAGLILADEDEPGSYAFAHALVRDAVYAGLGPARRLELHGRAAEALEASDGSRRAEIAGHLAACAVSPAQCERAALAALAAAEDAISQLAYEAASADCEQALELLERAGAPAGRVACRALILHGAALARAEGMPAARGSFERAAAIAIELDDPQLLAQAALGRSGIGVTIFAIDDHAVELLERAAAALGGEPPGLVALVLARLAIELYYSPDREHSERLSAEAVEAAQRSGDDGTLAVALNARHVSLWHPAGLEDRSEIALEMRAAAQRAGDREAELQATHWVAINAFERGEIDLFEREADEHERLARELRLDGFLWYAPLWRAALAGFRGRFDEVDPLLAEAHALGTAAGDANADVLCPVLEAQVQIAKDQVHLFDQGFLESRVDTDAGPAYVAALALSKAHAGDGEAALVILEEIGPERLSELPRDVNLTPALVDAAEVATFVGDRRWAERLYAELLPFEGHNLVFARGAGCYGSGARQVGQLALVLGDLGAAQRHLERAVAFEGAMGCEPWLLRSKLALARVLSSLNDSPERARDLAAEAEASARSLGIGALAEQAAELRLTLA
jgi:DNA-binding SARP family transcriptional activator